MAEGDIVGEEEVVALTEGVADGVKVPVGLPLEDAPEEIDDVADGVGEAVSEGVGEGDGSTTPCTNKGPAYIVPALAVEFQAMVGKLPAVAPVHTFTKVRMP